MNKRAKQHDLSGNDYAALAIACVAAVVIAFLPASIVQAVSGVPLPASLLGVAAVVGVAYFRDLKAGR